MSDNPKFSFVIPILDSGHLLKDCLESIRKQNYPQEKIEIITPDGGSRDKGPQIAKKYGAKVIENPKILAEPGFMQGSKIATGDLIVYMGADNRLVARNWAKRMVRPFEDAKIMAAFPWHRNNPKNTWLTRYFNTFTDPINQFVLQDACNPLYFHRAFNVKKQTKDYVVYDFSLNNFPMLAFDQGFTVRASYKRSKNTEYDDVLPVLDMIKKKMQIAYVPQASNYHYTLEGGLPQFVKKMRWIIDNNLSGKSIFGFPTRLKYLNTSRQIRFYLWPIYAISIVGPIIMTLIGLIRDRKKEWIYHFPITLTMIFLVAFEYLRIKILNFNLMLSRQ